MKKFTFVIAPEIGAAKTAAVMGLVPVSTAPSVGAVKVRPRFATKTRTTPEVLLWPVVSCATAKSAFEPAGALLTTKVNGAVASEPTNTPPRYRLTFVTVPTMDEAMTSTGIGVPMV